MDNQCVPIMPRRGDEVCPQDMGPRGRHGRQRNASATKPDHVTVPSGAYQRNGRLNTIAVTAKLVADVIVKIKRANDTARKLIAVSRPAVCRSPRRQESSMSVIESTNGQNGAHAVSAIRASRIQFRCCSSALGDSAALAPYTLGMSTRVLKSPVAIRGSSFMLRHDSCLTIVSDGRASPAPWPWPASVYTTGPTAAAVHQMDY